VIGKLADNHVGEQSYIGFAPGDGMIGHDLGDDAGARFIVIRQCVLGPLIDIDDELPGRYSSFSETSKAITFRGSPVWG
jgi:hypothetical protein